MTYQTILVQRQSGVLYVTLNRPEILNVLNFQTISEVEAALGAASSDPEVRVVVLSGG